MKILMIFVTVACTIELVSAVPTSKYRMPSETKAIVENKETNTDRLSYTPEPYAPYFTSDEIFEDSIEEFPLTESIDMSLADSPCMYIVEVITNFISCTNEKESMQSIETSQLEGEVGRCMVSALKSQP